MRSTAISSQKSSNSAPILHHRTQLPYFPLLHVAEAHRSGEQVPSHLTIPRSCAGPRAHRQQQPYFLIWSIQPYSQSHTPLHICCDQQPDFMEILGSELSFHQNDPQTSQSSIHRYCSLQSSALVYVPALNKLAEILELVGTAWCCPQVNVFFPRGYISLQQTYPWLQSTCRAVPPCCPASCQKRFPHKLKQTTSDLCSSFQP